LTHEGRRYWLPKYLTETNVDIDRHWDGKSILEKPHHLLDGAFKSIRQNVIRLVIRGINEHDSV
jgi:hypothetical protein